MPPSAPKVKFRDLKVERTNCAKVLLPGRGKRGRRICCAKSRVTAARMDKNMNRSTRVEVLENVDWREGAPVTRNDVWHSPSSILNRRRPNNSRSRAPTGKLYQFQRCADRAKN